MNTSHYPSLELCKELTDIGFPEPTEKYYVRDWIVDKEWMKENWPCDCAICPSVMEMLDVMPENSKFELYNQWDNEWTVTWYYTDDEEQKHIQIEYRIWTIPNALAEMILWLHENNFISFSK